VPAWNTGYGIRYGRYKIYYLLDMEIMIHLPVLIILVYNY